MLEDLHALVTMADTKVRRVERELTELRKVIARTRDYLAEIDVPEGSTNGNNEVTPRERIRV